MFEFRNQCDSFCYDTISSKDRPFIGRVKKTLRWNETRIRQKYHHRGFSFQREFYIFYICPTIIIVVVIYSCLSFEMENNQCDSLCYDTIRSRDRPFIGQVKKMSTYFISVQLLLLLLSSIRVWVSKWRTINAIHFVTIQVVRIGHLSGEWKRRTRRESDKSIIAVDSRFNANSTYFISVQLLLLLLSSICVWVSKWRTINTTHFVTIRLVTSSTDQPFIGRVKKTNETRIRQKYHRRGFSF